MNKQVKHKSLTLWWVNYFGVDRKEIDRSCQLELPYDGMILPADKFTLGEVWEFELNGS